MDTAFPWVQDTSPSVLPGISSLECMIQEGFRSQGWFWPLFLVSSDNQQIQEVAKIKEKRLLFLHFYPLPHPNEDSDRVPHLNILNEADTAGKGEKGLQKSQRITLFFFSLRFILNRVSEGIEEVMRTRGMVSSTSGLLNMCAVFLLREFNTLARNCDLALNQGVTYLKEPWCTMEGGRAAPGSPAPTPSPAIPESSSQSSPRMLSGTPFSTRSRVFSVRYMQIPCPYSAKWIFQACSFKNSLAWKG